MDLGIMSDQPLAKKKLLAIGLSPLKVSEITACLDHALITDMPLVGYGKFIWKLFYRTSILLPGIQKQYEPLVRRFCHHLSVQDTPTRGLKTTGNNVSSYVIEVLKTVALLSDDDIALDATMNDLGADSQDVQQINNVIRDEIGFKDTDVNVMDVGRMVIQELIDKISKLNFKKQEQKQALSKYNMRIETEPSLTINDSQFLE